MSITCKGTSFFDLGSQNIKPKRGYSLFPSIRCMDSRTYIDESISDNVHLVRTARWGISSTPAYGRWGAYKSRLPMQTFCTGSRYIGEWNCLGFAGEGIYRYPHGVIYEGEFNKQGKFHGLGTLIYPNGQKVQGLWKNGKLLEGATYVFDCGEYLDENFNYCSTSDRRFHVEIQSDFGPVGHEYLTATQPTIKLPQGCYDVGYGIFDPSTGFILETKVKTGGVSLLDAYDSTLFSDDQKLDDLDQISRWSNESEDGIDGEVTCLHETCDVFTVGNRKILEIPTAEKVKWIKEYCRKAWDEPTGYQPELYKTWMAGRLEELFGLARSDSNVTVLTLKRKKNSTETSASRPRAPKLFSFIQKKCVAPPNTKFYTGRKYNELLRSKENKRNFFLN